MDFWYHSTSFFITSKKKLFGCSWSHVCTACWTRAEPVLHVLTWIFSLLWLRHPPSVDMLIRAWCRWATRSAFIRYTYSSLLKAFYSLIDHLLMHRVCSILCQHLVMDFRRFNLLCPQKMHYGALFLDGAITEWSRHTSTLVALCHVTERWNAACG
jgi:hypothetical protein